MDAKRIDVSENMVAVRSLIEQFPQASGVLVGKYDLEALEALLTAAGERQGLRERCAELEQALAESLKLQSHYAALLNQYDGGERIIFGGANEFLERLAALKGEGS